MLALNKERCVVVDEQSTHNYSMQLGITLLKKSSTFESDVPVIEHVTCVCMLHA